MVHIHITVKESERIPNKNALLWQYTQVWLANELLFLNEPTCVTVTKRGEPLYMVRIPPKWDVHQLDTPHVSHLQDQLEACQYSAQKNEPETPFEETLHILVQLTQPVRRPYLLRDAVQAMRTQKNFHNDLRTHLVSCNGVKADTPFRQMVPGERQFDYGTVAKDGKRIIAIDGALWAWYGHPAKIFLRRAASPLFNTTPWCTIDIDTEKDIPHALPAIWAETLLEIQPTIRNGQRQPQ